MCGQCALMTNGCVLVVIIIYQNNRFDICLPRAFNIIITIIINHQYDFNEIIDERLWHCAV